MSFDLVRESLKNQRILVTGARLPLHLDTGIITFKDCIIDEDYFPFPMAEHRFENCTFEEDAILETSCYSKVSFYNCRFKTGARIKFNHPPLVTIHACYIETGVVWDDVDKLSFAPWGRFRSLRLLPRFETIQVISPQEEEEEE